MEKFEVKKQRLKEALSGLEQLLDEGQRLGLDLTDAAQKLRSVVQASEDETIRIVLLGSFSDGKTSAIAGLLGRLEDSMKIDQDESSDELKIYRPKDLKDGFEIVDTPGLFGTKEKETDGQTMRYSEITERYISEAHIVIYVCHAVVPLKDSHKEIIRLVMRDFGKLDCSIFVINKMDEAGTDMLDADDYAEMAATKKKNLIQRLRDTILLTPEEEASLRIACITADPKGKGLAHWFARPDDYMKRSHIGLLRDYITEITEKKDAVALRENKNIAAVKDAMMQVEKEIFERERLLSADLERSQEAMKEIDTELRLMKKDVEEGRQTMSGQIRVLFDGVRIDIDTSTCQSISPIIEQRLGLKDGEVGFILERDVNQILQNCSERDDLKISSVYVGKLESLFEDQSEIMRQMVKQGGKTLGSVKVSSETVKSTRNVVAPNHKFKPGGAKKIANKTTKVLNGLDAALTMGMEIWDAVESKKRENDLAELKSQLKGMLADMQADIYAQFNDNESYYKNFAPSFLEMQQHAEEMQEAVDRICEQTTRLHDYGERLRKHFDIKDTVKDTVI